MLENNQWVKRATIQKLGLGSVTEMFNRRMLQKVLTLADMEALSEKRMSRVAHAYLSGAAGDEITLHANREQWAQIRLNPNILLDVSEVDLTVKIIGQTLDIPIVLAPIAINQFWHKSGEMGVVAGANQGKVILVTSTYATESVENVCKAATQPVWFQLYTRPDREFNQDLIQRAEAAGCKAIVVTVDTPVVGIRNREERAYFRLPPHLNLPNLKIGPEIHRRSPITLSACCPMLSLHGRR